MPAQILNSTRERGSLWLRAENRLLEEDRVLLKFEAGNKPQIANEVLQLARAKREECDRKKWKYTRENGRVIELRTVITNVTTYVQRFISVGNVISSYDPVHFALPWAGVKILLQVRRRPLPSSVLIRGQVRDQR